MKTQLGILKLSDPKVDDEEIALSMLSASKDIGGKTVHSISGGRSSAYMAMHYPADHLVFALVLTEDPACRIQDKGLLSAIRQKCPEFEGSRELDMTLLNVLRLEQELGKEIRWCYGVNYDQLIRERKMLPNQAMRFCTKEMKVMPIFSEVFANILTGEYSESLKRFIADPIQMSIGFRYDEAPRVYKMLGAERTNNKWDWSAAGACEKFKVSLECDIEGKFKKQHRWIKNYEWRIRQAPMFVDRITRAHVNKYWEKKGWNFPEISNCDFCFFHTAEQMREQKRLYPDRAEWGLRKEAETGATFNKKASMREIFDGAPVSSMPLFNNECACTD